MAEGVDYSWARPGGAALAAAGKTFAIRYLSAGGGKGLTAAEVADLHTHGIAIAVIFESSGNEALAGNAAGASDASSAQSQLVACGLPTDLPIYFAVDFNAVAGQLAAIDDYLNGAGSVLGQGRVGVYGSYAVTTHCRASGTAPWGWQTYAWSGGLQDAGANLYQYQNGQTINGGAVDFVRSLTTNFGQSSTATTAPTSAAAPTPVAATGLTVDGNRGPLTIKAEQRALHVTADGNFGPISIRAEQARVGVTVDGVRGPQTIKGVQRHVGATQDGNEGPHTIQAEQRALNAGTF